MVNDVPQGTSMNKRPLSVTIVAWIYIVGGAGGIAVHGSELNAQHPFSNDAVLVLVVRLLAVVAGAFMLRAASWARWLAMLWMGYHVVLSLHSVAALGIHALLLAVFAYFLLRPQANAYFAAGSHSNLG